MSDTPRTDRLLTAILDAHGFVHRHNCPPQWVMFARELERELNAANQRIKRLEREVELFREYSNYGDVGVVDSMLRGEEMATKEDKP